MNVLLNRLLSIINNYSPLSTEHHIAIVLLNHLFELGGLSVKEVAELCTVAKSTLSKFVREIGFDDYKDFRLAAAAAVDGVNYNLGESITGHMERYGIKDYIAIVKKDIDLMAEALDYDKLEELAHDLVRYEQVAAFGTVYSETAAIDLQYKLAFCKKIIKTSTNDKVQEEYIQNATADTLVIIFTNSGRYITEYQLIEGYPRKDIFNETKAKIVAITANKELENDPRVDLCISFPYSSSVQNHPIIYQIVTDMIAVSYKKVIK